MAEFAASLREINHTWLPSGVMACRDVSLDLRSGSIHALVGENGAGKTTLGHILAGVRKPDAGTLQLTTGVVNLHEHKKGIFHEIGLIRQRNIWPPALTVREAAILGRKDSPKSIRKQQGLFIKTAEEWGLSGIDPEMPVSRMDSAMLQRAEMIASLMFNPEVLVLDEPSSAWEEGRGDEFFNLLRRLKDIGRGVLLITHKLEDVFSIADDVTVMRHGSVAGTWETKETDYSMLTREMFGEAETSGEDHSRGPLIRKDIPALLEADKIGITISGRRELESVSFHVRPGEILGITGLREEGLSSLEDVISGNRRLGSGTLKVNSKNIQSGAAGMRQAGLHYVPSDKTGRGASLKSTMSENMIVLESRNLAKSGWLHPRRVLHWTESRKNDGGIAGKPDQKLDELSGGNIQKVILQREITSNTRLLVVADPTWGLDERSRQQIHQKLRQTRDRGAAILLLASDLDEAIDLSDRMGVISGGRLSDILPTDEWNRNQAAELIAGGKR